MRRYPLQPLLELTGWTMNRVTQIAPCNGGEYRLRLADGVTERTAERIAVAAGYHALEVWPEMIEEAYSACAAADCERRFIPTRKGHSYCSDRCRERVRMRLKYQTDEAHRAMKRAARTDFYNEVGHYERARERRKYHANAEAARARSRAYYAANAEDQRRKAVERRRSAHGPAGRVAA